MGWLSTKLRQAMEANQCMERGEAAGLTKDEANEVLGAWVEHNLRTGASWDPERVRRSMDARADGRPWQPPPTP